MITKEQKSKMGKKSRADGAAWERRVRDLLTEDGWFVSKFQSNIDLETRKLIAAKSNMFMARSMGFPDFIIWKKTDWGGYDVRGIECKCNGFLSADEKQKMAILKELGVFSRLFIAKKCKKNERCIFAMYMEFDSNEWKTSMY